MGGNMMSDNGIDVYFFRMILEEIKNTSQHFHKTFILDFDNHNRIKVDKVHRILKNPYF